MTGLDADLATWRSVTEQGERAMCELVWTIRNTNWRASADRVEAEIARLREERDEYAERLAWHRDERDAYLRGNLWVKRAAEEQERAEAAEREVARLREGLRRTLHDHFGWDEESLEELFDLLAEDERQPPAGRGCGA